jgi:hypothetical protein
MHAYQGDVATAYGSYKYPNMFLVGVDGRIKAVQSGLNGMEQMEYEVCLEAAKSHPLLWCGPEGLTCKDVNSLQAARGDSVWKDDWKSWIGWRIRRYSCLQKTREVLVGSGYRFSSLSRTQRYKSSEDLCVCVCVCVCV